MCIIIYKPKGQEIPDKDIFKNCFNRNKDGAGFMYPHEGRVQIEKGFMEFDDFYEVIENRTEDGLITKEKPAIFHCRIKTTGKVQPENTHPFPISSKIGDLRKTLFKTDIAVAHNGVIPIKTSFENSDTQTFVKKILSKYIPQIKSQCKATHEAIKKQGGSSKFAFMTPEKVTTLGNWEKDNGIHYSNTTYKKIKPYRAPYRGYSDWSKDADLKDAIEEMLQYFWECFTLYEFDFEKASSAVHIKFKYRLELTSYLPKYGSYYE